MKIDFNNMARYQNLLNIILFLILFVGVVLTVSCKSQTPALAPPTMSDGTPLAPGEPEEPLTPLQIEVAITASGFDPATYNIPAGALVLWYNDNSVDHTVTARDNSFDSGRISPNETFKYTFEESGEFEYYCKIHPSMVGKITIE